jgi:hypothetical protein
MVVEVFSLSFFLHATPSLTTSVILLNQIRVLSPDGSLRILIATKQNGPLDNNTSLVIKGDVLCTANLGFAHANSEEADRTAVCIKGFPVPKCEWVDLRTVYFHLTRTGVLACFSENRRLA